MDLPLSSAVSIDNIVSTCDVVSRCSLSDEFEYAAHVAVLPIANFWT